MEIWEYWQKLEAAKKHFRGAKVNISTGVKTQFIVVIVVGKPKPLVMTKNFSVVALNPTS